MERERHVCTTKLSGSLKPFPTPRKPMTTLLSLTQVTKQYGEQKAVNNVDMTLQAGECVRLAGHNGAGKSTVMKLILGLIRPSAGSVTLFGENVSGGRAAEIRRKIGYLPESVALHPSLTGKETMDFYAKLKGVDTQGNQALLERVGIAQSAHKRVGAYSKGMRQRLALAQALLGAPQVLLFDEPTTGLDPASRQLFYQIVHELKTQGATVLLCTHALAELDGHADRVVVMKNGRKLADGNMHELQVQSGLPVRMDVTLAREVMLPKHWYAVSGCPNRYISECQANEKAARLQELGSLDNITAIDIHTPTLDEVYAEFLKREDV